MAEKRWQGEEIQTASKSYLPFTRREMQHAIPNHFTVRPRILEPYTIYVGHVPVEIPLPGILTTLPEINNQLQAFMAKHVQRKVQLANRAAKGGDDETAKRLGTSIAMHSARLDMQTKWRNIRGPDSVIVLCVSNSDHFILNTYASFGSPLATGHPAAGATYVLLPGDYIFTEREEKYIYQLEGSWKKVKAEDLPALALT